MENIRDLLKENNINRIRWRGLIPERDDPCNGYDTTEDPAWAVEEARNIENAFDNFVYKFNKINLLTRLGINAKVLNKRYPIISLTPEKNILNRLIKKTNYFLRKYFATEILFNTPPLVILNRTRYSDTNIKIVFLGIMGKEEDNYSNLLFYFNKDGIITSMNFYDGWRSCYDYFNNIPCSLLYFYDIYKPFDMVLMEWYRARNDATSTNLLGLLPVEIMRMIHDFVRD